MARNIDWPQALAWRMQRQLLDPVGRLSVEDVVRRICGVQAQVPSSAELAIRLRQESSGAGEVDRALADGRLIRTWAMRGTIHLLTPGEGGAFLSLMAAGRSWERGSWQRAFGMTPEELDALRPVVRDVIDGAPLTREELVTAIEAQPGFEHLSEALRSGWGTLLKPLAWQGDLCFGPPRGARVTFTRPERASSRWAGVPGPEEAAPVAVVAYLRAHGPATMDAFGNWMSRGRIAKRQLRSWFDALGDRLHEIEVEGEPVYVLSEDVDELAATGPTEAVRLLAGFDQFILGGGTDDGRVVPTARRDWVSKQSGWISPVVVAGGVVSGTWELDGDQVRVAWFKEAGKPPRGSLDKEVTRLAAILDRSIAWTVGPA
jgi:hypothetical protein